MPAWLFHVAAIAVGCFVAAPSAVRAAGYEVIYHPPSGASFQPAVGAVAGETIYLSEPDAGAAGDGMLFTLSTAGTHLSPMFTFNGGDGSKPNARLVVSAGGAVTGTTQAGGSAGAGTVFQVTASGVLAWSHSLDGTLQGSDPMDGLAEGPGGLLYGTTAMGAIAPGNGTLFSVSLKGQFAVRYRFHSAGDGHCPFTGVTVDAAGDIYGTTVGLGFGGRPTGALWRERPGHTPVTVYQFRNGNDGEYPMITPTVDATGRVWGVSQTAGAAGSGSVWVWSPVGGIAVRHVFSGAADGGHPAGPLLLGHDGNLYGTTADGGDGHGTVFRVTPAGAFTTLHRFAGGADGGVPTAPLAADALGRIYGGTQAGTIFRVTP